MSLFVFLGIFLFLFLPKSHGDGGMVTAADVGWRWESLAMILHVSGTILLESLCKFIYFC